MFYFYSGFWFYVLVTNFKKCLKDHETLYLPFINKNVSKQKG